MNLVALDKNTFAKQYTAFTIIDTRSVTTYNAAYLQDSINLATKDSVAKFIEHKFGSNATSFTFNKPLLFLCFSTKKAKDFAKFAMPLLQTTHYPFKEVYYLTSGVMELYDSGFTFIEKVFHQDTKQTHFNIIT